MMRSCHCLALLVGVSLLGACQGSEDQAAPASEDLPEELPSLPAVEPPLDREALILAVVHSASNFALGRPEPDEQRELGGKPFAIRLRFGCPDDDTQTRSWSFDERSRVLRISIQPQISLETPVISSLQSTEIEDVEGFWVRKPWMLEPACPVAPSAAERSSVTGQQSAPAAQDPGPAPAPADQSRAEPRVGIAQFFTTEDSRAERRNDRAYEATVQLGEGQRPSSDGYDLVLSGRLAPLADGRVIACTGEANAAPTCVVSAAFDHVAVTSPAGETLAEWSRS